MNIQQLKETLENLGYHAPVNFKRRFNQDVVHIDQKLDELNEFGNPILKTLGYAWFENNRFYMNYRRRIPHPDIREFLSIDELISFIQREFPLIEE